MSDELQSSRAEPSRPSPVVPPRDTPLRTIGEVPDDVLSEVIADGAERSGARSAQVEVVRAEAVQWRDGSLGCPEPGMMYPQVIIDGYWVELQAGGQLYDYRLDGQGNFRLCEQPFQAPPPGGHHTR